MAKKKPVKAESKKKTPSKASPARGHSTRHGVLPPRPPRGGGGAKSGGRVLSPRPPRGGGRVLPPRPPRGGGSALRSAKPAKSGLKASPVERSAEPASPKGAGQKVIARPAKTPVIGKATGKAVTGKAVTGKALARRTLGASSAAPPSRDAVRSDGKVLKPKTPGRRIPQSELTKIRTLLAQKKIALTNHLQTELSELEKPEKRHRTDLEEIASDTHDTDSLCEIMDIEANQIGQIDMALAKIDNGTYGICEDCGGEIPLVRLEALPFATQCIECKRRAEIQGQISALEK